MKRVQVLLSTYNGEQYIREQLDSILQQDYENIQILIRDDGSTDRTVSILEEYSKEYSNVTYYAGNNVGVINSFFDLIKCADETADYYAFSDQDDVWLKEKITMAVDKLEEKLKAEKKVIPLLYSSVTTLVDKDLKILPYGSIKQNYKATFGNALVENICAGCTCVINHVLWEILKDRLPQFTMMHDWWIYLTASFYGKVIFDTKSYILYRQHGKNVLGGRKSYLQELSLRLKKFKKSQGKFSRQADEFIRVHQISSKGKGALAYYVAEYKKNLKYRLKVVTSNQIIRQRKMDDLVFRLLFLTGMR
ncbi:glycosyltransferase family 2 protein [Anaeromicropila populeti]|nr:glycosyltransferase family 2 protein [Anaeromicropila populeti]